MYVCVYVCMYRYVCTVCTVGIIKKFPYCFAFRFALLFPWGLRCATMRFVWGLRRVCMGLPFRDGLFTVCIIIHYHNSGTIYQCECKVHTLPGAVNSFRLLY